MNRLVVLFAALLILPGCASMQGKVADHVSPAVAAQELDSSELLDVAIVVFDSAELTDEEISELGLSEEIRRAEERYMPIHLKYTMQRTGYWGAVRVVPAPSKAHLQVHGTIVHSDGEQLILEIEAYDSRNVKWFEKSYSEELRLSEYSGIAPEKKDPFQDVYNTIANDLAAHRDKLTAEDFREIQQVSELRAAHDMAPDAFDQPFRFERDEGLGNRAFRGPQIFGKDTGGGRVPVGPREIAQRLPLRRVQPLGELKRMRDPTKTVYRACDGFRRCHNAVT